METRKKLLIGGLGATTPVIVNLLVTDFKVLLVDVTIPTVIGFLIKAVVLFYVGGLVAVLHKDEKNPIRIFELGILAPALIISMVNGANIDTSKIQAQISETSAPSFSLVASLYALPPQEDVKQFTLPKENPKQQFLRGLTGSRNKNVWFVIVGSHGELEDAREQVRQIAQREDGFEAEVYAPYGRNTNYSVVIGALLTYKQAKKLKKRALDAGFPEDTYLWTFPKK